MSESYLPKSNRSILDSLRNGLAIDIKTGSFGGGGGVAFFDSLFSMITLKTGETSYEFFNPGKPSVTNVGKSSGPGGGERWDLLGLGWQWWAKRVDNDAEAFVSGASFLDFVDWVRSASLTVKMNTTTVMDRPLRYFLGELPVLIGVDNATPITASARSLPDPQRSWLEMWPEELWWTLEENVQFSFLITCAATNANVDGQEFAAFMPRVKASKN